MNGPGKSELHALRTAFVNDGVVCLPSALDVAAMELATEAFEWTRSHPGPHARNMFAGCVGEFYQDHANPASWPAYCGLMHDSPLAALVADLLSTDGLWLFYEQIWLKEGGDTLATPWHQDLPYVPLAGDQLATVWISLDPVDSNQSLEFVLGSHHGPLFNPTIFDPDDPAACLFAEGSWPPLPDIEARRDEWRIVRWPMLPGDLLVFHPAILHGGAPTRAGRRRRTITLRFFGDRAYCAERPPSAFPTEERCDPAAPEDVIAKMACWPPGTLFRHPSFHRVR